MPKSTEVHGDSKLSVHTSFMHVVTMENLLCMAASALAYKYYDTPHMYTSICLGMMFMHIRILGHSRIAIGQDVGELHFLQIKTYI